MSILAVEIDLEQMLVEVAQLVMTASIACKNWEAGGSPEAVGETAAAALDIANCAICLAQNEEGEPNIASAPETRRGRLLTAGWLMLLAGTDEHGESVDLATASKIFRKAADA